MSFRMSVLVSGALFALLFLFGPIILLPTTAWIVFSELPDCADKQSKLMGSDKLLIGSLAICFAVTTATFYSFNTASIIEFLRFIGSWAIWPIAADRILLSATTNASLLESAAFIYSLYLISLSLFFFVMFHIARRVYEFKRSILIHFKPAKHVGLLRVVFAFILVIFITVFLHVSIYEGNQVDRLQRFKYRHYLVMPMLFIVISIIELFFWYNLKRLFYKSEDD